MQKNICKVIALLCVLLFLFSCIMPAFIANGHSEPVEVTLSDDSDIAYTERITTNDEEALSQSHSVMDATEAALLYIDETQSENIDHAEIGSFEDSGYFTDPSLAESYDQLSFEVYEEFSDPQNYDECIALPYYMTECDIDLIANVLTHEVGGICGDGIYVAITYANGETVEYRDGCILHRIHTQVFLNQYNSSMFPDSISQCIRLYWMRDLASLGYYSKSNSTWQHCRLDVLEALTNGSTIPNNVYAATCDPNFTSKYSGYYLYATVYWNTGWCRGTFYYYQYG